MPILPGAGLLRPVIALNLWTFTMEAWMYALRLPAISKYNLNMSPEKAKQEMATKIPPQIQWPAENYNHLMEQPTQFYAVAISSVLLGVGDDSTMINLAWAYVGARVVHSLVQSTKNVIMVRFGIFVTSSFILLGLTGKAATLVF